MMGDLPPRALSEKGEKAVTNTSVADRKVSHKDRQPATGSMSFASLSANLLLLTLLLIAGETEAVVTGLCSDCHTMHNSQNAATMRLDSTPITGGGAGECLDCHAQTRASLLRLDCLGCHAQDVNGGANITGSMPQVAHNAATDLAGGNYRYVFADDTHGHNVHGFGNGFVGPDSNLGNTPPGYNAAFDPATGKYNTANMAGQLMCSGQNGCHGNRDQVSQILAMQGTHHADDKILKFGANFTETGQGATPGKSYRFLYKVHGAEDSDWQSTSGAADHNEYKGAVYGVRAGQAWGDIVSMSQFCAECHGNFHASAGVGGPGTWLRHPTDVALPAYTNYTAYTPQIPAARTAIASGTAQASGLVTPGSNADVVVCLSCHRAHASPYPDMLRWDYGNMAAGTGCYVCHTEKD